MEDTENTEGENPEGKKPEGDKPATAAKASQTPTTKTTMTTRTLRVELEREEIRELCSEAADLDQDNTNLAEQKKDKAAEFTGKIKSNEGRISDLLQAVRDGGEMREVGCKTVFDYEAQTATTTRNDTNEVVEERPLSVDEAQQQFAALESFFDADIMAWVENTLRGTPTISLASMQRRFDLDPDAAAKLAEIAEEKGWIGPPEEGGESRQVLIFEAPAGEGSDAIPLEADAPEEGEGEQAADAPESDAPEEEPDADDKGEDNPTDG